MKPSRSVNNIQSKQGHSHKPLPEITDNIDSRKKEEQSGKGGDRTHITKEKHSKGSRGMINRRKTCAEVVSVQELSKGIKDKQVIEWAVGKNFTIVRW